MFTAKSKTSANQPLATNSFISAGMIVHGNIESSGDMRIDGIVKGNISCKGKLIIGVEGVVEGDIVGKQSNVMGTVSGKISMTDLLYLNGKAKVEGDIHAGQLQIDSTVSFNGNCHMGANVVEFIPDMSNVSAMNE